ncbi:MAG: cellulose-binding domain-containing protein, partial [Streptosporangiaceae bacterium]|nr:cellulose-binding domain-containing protein [Streptosporangiaceae bacterium]MBV9855617.1 cellulose-binding domain-containing protein [Streptosporangiaceae bacterium]
PDIISWHELESSGKIAGDVSTVTGIEKSLGITPRPVAIEEYAAPSQVGIPGDLTGYIAQFERLGISNAELAFWNHYGTLGDLLTDTGAQPNAAYWLYDWYGQMTGNMVTVVPPGTPGTGLDGAASVSPGGNQVSVIFGGGSGPAAVTVNGLSALSGFGGTAHVVLDHVVSQGRTTAVAASQIQSTAADYTIANGTITVPVSSMNAADGYHLVITPAGSPPGNTVTVMNPGNQAAAAGTAIAGLQVHASDSAAGQNLAYSATGLPTGLSISSSGLISGTPATAGTYTVTVTATDSTGASGKASFTWTITGTTTGGGCTVTYTTSSQWAGGFVANVTITNTGTSAVSGWTLTFTFPGDQRITSAWNATVTQSGQAVTATNASYDGAIAPGANVSLGFQGTWTSSDSSPTAFTLNGTACGLGPAAVTR